MGGRVLGKDEVDALGGVKQFLEDGQWQTEKLN